MLLNIIDCVQDLIPDGKDSSGRSNDTARSCVYKSIYRINSILSVIVHRAAPSHALNRRCPPNVIIIYVNVDDVSWIAHDCSVRCSKVNVR